MLIVTPEPCDPQVAEMVVTEIVRHGVARISNIAADPTVDIDARVQTVNDHLQSIRSGLRTRDYTLISPEVERACHRLALKVPSGLPPEISRDILAIQRDLAKIEVDVLDDGESPVSAAHNLTKRFEITLKHGQMPSLLRLSDVLPKALEGLSEEMARKLMTTVDMLIEFAGDLPLVRMKSEILPFLVWLSRLPKTHGKTAGLNE